MGRRIMGGRGRILGVFLACVPLTCLGCYVSTVRVMAPSASGEVVIEQEWMQRRLTKPETWPEYLLMYPRTPTAEPEPKITAPTQKT